MFSELRKELTGRNHSVPQNKPAPVIAKIPTIDPTVAVLVIACNRVDYTKQTLDELLK